MRLHPASPIWCRRPPNIASGTVSEWTAPGGPSYKCLMPKANVVSFINMKGGVGKTTCAEAFRNLTVEFLKRLEK
jgi:hypothetical protein